MKKRKKELVDIWTWLDNLSDDERTRLFHRMLAEDRQRQLKALLPGFTSNIIVQQRH